MGRYEEEGGEKGHKERNGTVGGESKDILGRGGRE